MNLAEKMFTRGAKSCPIRSDCKRESDRRYFASLFQSDWEVFVVKRNNEKGLFEWFTLGREGDHLEKDGKRIGRSAACC